MGGATRFIMLLTTTTTPSPLLPSLLRLSCRRRQLLSFPLSSFPHHRRHSSHLSVPGPSRLNASQQQEHHTQPASSFHRHSDWPAQPWPELSSFIKNLSISNYFNKQTEINFELMNNHNLPDDFVDAVSACFAFALEKPYLLGMLSRRDIEVVVDKGTPFLFKDGDVSKRKLIAFLGNNVEGADKPHTIDLMKLLLSYASCLESSEMNNLPGGELESSIRHLFSELAELSYTPQKGVLESGQNQFPERHGQSVRPIGKNVEMKRGDWICPRCSFMNFARNMKCRECEEARPKRQLTGGEWECPQCDFFNYGRNIVCLRCDYKRPGGVPLGTTNSISGLGHGNGNNFNVDSRLAANEEKAQRWFSKISEIDNNSANSNDIVDEDFPEIMPLRKGVNRFVVSTRKAPIERRLAKAGYRSDLGSSGIVESTGANTTANQLSQGITPRGSNYVPFVPLPPDMFAKKHDGLETSKSEVETDSKSLASPTDENKISGSNELSKLSENWQPSEKPSGQNPSAEKEKEQAEKSERWFKRVAELHNVTDLASEISDEEFPEIMPMRKGENRFVVNKRKDRSLTSPMYKRRLAMEQANEKNFVPFVPFPPNYFSQKDNQQSGGADSADTAVSGSSKSTAQGELSKKFDDDKPKVSTSLDIQRVDNQKYSTGSLDSRPLQNPSESKADRSYGLLPSGNLQDVCSEPNNGGDSWNRGFSGNENVSGTSAHMGNSMQNYISPASGRDGGNIRFSDKEGVEGTANLTGITSQVSEKQNIREGWSGKSLEGSAVKEPDPLDMSEEAKAERWFRRAAQIKDISELSQIPDEDFPSIMPMRKGVNRFVVSKRKTPLERRLTSTQYRRNMPTLSSEPVNENDSG